MLIFDLFFPNFAILLTDHQKEIHELEWKDPENPEHIIRRYFVRQKTNMLQQYFEGEFIFRTFVGEKIIKEERSPLKMSFYTYPHICLLLRHCGLEIVEEYGSFAKEPIEVEKEMIFIVRKSKQ